MDQVLLNLNLMLFSEYLIYLPLSRGRAVAEELVNSLSSASDLLLLIALVSVGGTTFYAVALVRDVGVKLDLFPSHFCSVIKSY